MKNFTILEAAALLLLFSALAPFGFGIIMDSYYFIGFVTETTLQSVLLAYSLGLVSSVVHAFATVGFTAIIYLPWVRKLERIKRKYGISDSSVSESAIAESGTTP